MTAEIDYVIITPVRDERHFVEKTIISVLGQTVRPSEWIIVDDGSTDGSAEVLDAYSSKYHWIKVVHKEDRGSRKPGSGVIEAFFLGLQHLGNKSWDFIVKLDGDLSFPSNYFEQCFQNFAVDPNLGIAGGSVCKLENGKQCIDSSGDPAFHVRGATKIYRHKCWNDIAPLLQAPGWDTIDEVKANYHGWTTRTFPNIKLLQLKPTGGADGNWNNAYKNGRANYITGYHPLFMAAKCIKRALRKPVLMQSVALATGYISGYLKRVPRVPEKEVIRYLRKQQIRRLLLQSSIYE